MTANTPRREEVATGAAASIEEASTDLHILDGLLPYVAHLLRPVRGQRPMLRPKPTEEEQHRRQAQHAAERYDQVDNERRLLPIPGYSPAPVSIAATDAAVTITMGLSAINRALWSHLAACAFPPTRSVTDRGRIRTMLRHMPSVTDSDVARLIATEAASARRAAEVLIFGEPHRRLNARCPHCHRESLVIYPRDEREERKQRREHHDTPEPTDFIRCDKPEKADCYCSSASCPCKRGVPHIWTRARGGWDLLARLLTDHDRSCKECSP